ncbi:MAG: right-handed parallel beta-helix repeat-containing protein, partial [Crocinitomix sp.]|nr:right-handed parallel beta-helix repeat-containing protein [Crocinitomix sp.]
MKTMVGNDMFGPDINSLLGSQAVITLFFDDSIKISNCEIEDGAASIYANGSTNCLFENNLLKDFTICGINCKDSDSIDINQNVLLTALPYGYNEQLYGIRFQNSNDRIHVSNNYLKIEHGIALGAINCDFSENEIWNNAITNSIANTVSFQNVENTYLKFNSIHLMLDEDEDEPYDLMDFSDVSNFNCENTIFQNSTSGDFLTMDPLSAFFDYNDIFLNGGLFSPSYPSFEAWQLAGYGPNSFNVDPLFFTNENLRIQENPALFGQGNGIYPIVKDLESKSREIPPSLGAYRFGVDTIDLELIEIVAPVSCDSLLGLIVNFTNHGPDTLLGAYLFFDINDEVDSFYWTGNLPAGDTIFNLHLSPFIFDGDLAYDISVWTANENWHFDGITSNDTASTTISGSHLKGSFTIGEYYADFLNIQEAVIALKTSGMCGDVTLNFQNGLFPETVIFTDIPGLDTTHLTIQSISETGDNVVVTGRWIFNKIENITVQNMTFAESNPLESWSSFELEDTCANISFLGNKFGYLGITGYGAIVFRASGDFTDINIIGNQILYCTGLFISGNSLGDKTNIVIKDNDLGNRSQGGISLKYCDGLIFENNFNRLISGSNILATFDEISGIVEIKNNDLGRKGLRINNSDGTEVDPFLIYNNIIGSVHFSNVSYIKFNHNTVANMLTTGCLTGILILESGVTDFESYNNIFFLKSCDRFLDFKSALMLEEAANIYWDYNVYYANPVLPYHDDKIGHVLFANPSGSDWNMAQWLENTDYDDNSVWGDPQFISEINLHLNQDNVSPFLSDTLPVEVVDDIDNEVRDLTEPTIGADEFTPHSSNARLVGFDVPTICDSTKHIWALLVNTGTELLTSATLEWEIDGVALPSVIWTGALATLDTVDVYLGDHVVTTGHKIVRAWPTLPNGLTDPFTLFDTSQTELSIKFNGHYTVYGESADFSSLQIAIDSLTRYGICDSVYLNVRSGIYGDNINIGYIKGGSDSSWVVIQSETLDSNDVVYNGPGYTDDYAFEFDSAHYVQLRHITVDRYSPGSFGNISSIGIVNRSSNISICNNRLKSAYGTGPWNGVIHVGNAAVDGRDTEIHHI